MKCSIQKIVLKNFHNRPNTCELHKSKIPWRVTYMRTFFSSYLDFSAVDLFIGALDESPVIKDHLIASRSYYHDHLTWCIQKAKPIPKWQNIFYLFNDLTVFVSLVILVILLVAVGYFLMVVEHKKNNFFDLLVIILRCALGFSSAYQPYSHPVRIFIAFGMLAGMIFATLFGSILTTIASNPILRTQIVTVQETIMQGFSFAGDRFALDKIIQQNKVWTIKCIILIVLPSTD